MKILSITLEKCSGCAIMIDDKIIFSSSEERYTRIKSDSSFPRKSIEIKSEIKISII
jgi:predicted NodU family carbamoyl transferase